MKKQVNIRNMYLIGEGSGYTGGITSSAADAIRAVEAVLSPHRGRQAGITAAIMQVNFDTRKSLFLIHSCISWLKKMLGIQPEQ
jgi:precorrin-2 methylase